MQPFVPEAGPWAAMSVAAMSAHVKQEPNIGINISPSARAWFTPTMEAGAVVAQLQRGRWVTGFQNLQEASKRTCIPFCLTGSEELVMVGPQVSTLGNVVETARMKDPLTAKVAYHELVDQSAPGVTATLKHQHAWKSEHSDVMPAAGSLVTKSCAGWVSHSKWDHPATALACQLQ